MKAGVCGGIAWGVHLLSTTRGDTHRVKLPLALVYVRTSGMLTGRCHLNGDVHTRTDGVASRSRRGACTWALRGPYPCPAGGYARNTPSGSNRLRRGDQAYGERGISCPERQPSVSSWAGRWTATGPGAPAGQVVRRRGRDSRVVSSWTGSVAMAASRSAEVSS